MKGTQHIQSLIINLLDNQVAASERMNGMGVCGMETHGTYIQQQDVDMGVLNTTIVRQGEEIASKMESDGAEIGKTDRGMSSQLVSLAQFYRFVRATRSRHHSCTGKMCWLVLLAMSSAASTNCGVGRRGSTRYTCTARSAR